MSIYFHSRSLTLLALLCIWLVPASPVWGQYKGCCERNVLLNGDFSLGVQVGNGSLSGCAAGSSSLNDWCALSSPQYYSTVAAFGSAGVAMWGIGTNFSSGEGIYQSANLLAGADYRVSFGAFFADQVPTGPDSVIVRFRAYPAAPTGVNDPSGTLIGEFTIKNTIQSPGTYFLPDWTAPSNFTHFAVTVHNNSAVNNGQYVSWALLDHVCLEDVSELVSNDRPLPDDSGTLYPNPTEGILRWDFPAAWGDLGPVELFDGAGRKLEPQEVTVGAGTLKIDLGDLPSGIYFLSVDSDALPQRQVRRIIKE